MATSAPAAHAAAVDSLAGPSALSQRYAASLLQSLGVARPAEAPAGVDFADLDMDAARDWATSGLMALTGLPSGPPQRASHAVPSCARGAIAALEFLTGQTLPTSFDGGALLVERSRSLGLRRGGRVSPNGSCHLIAARDGVLALNLARRDDWLLLPAWLQEDCGALSWKSVSEKMSTRTIESLVARGRMLGLPVAAAPTFSGTTAPWFRLQSATRAVPHGASQLAPKSRARHTPVVIDLSALWAGPLCTTLLAETGARVIKVESQQRPDATRTGAMEFHSIVNAGKESVQLDFGSPIGRKKLHSLLQAADIVVESSRPRALEQLGIRARSILDQDPSKVWISLTGYGRSDPQADWVAFGDDAGVAAGLSVGTQDSEAPLAFCGDAIADPLAGMHAALAATAFWQRGDGGLVDINLCDVARHCRAFHTSQELGEVQWNAAGQTGALNMYGQRFPFGENTLREASKPVVALGADTDNVLREFSSC